MTSDDVGSRPSHFLIIPNTKRHPNNTKTDQLPMFGVMTGLPRPYLNTYPECGSILPGIIVYQYSISSSTASRIVYSYVRHTRGMYRMSFVQCAYLVTRLAL